MPLHHLGEGPRIGHLPDEDIDLRREGGRLLGSKDKDPHRTPTAEQHRDQMPTQIAGSSRDKNTFDGQGLWRIKGRAFVPLQPSATLDTLQVSSYLHDACGWPGSRS